VIVPFGVSTGHIFRVGPRQKDNLKFRCNKSQITDLKRISVQLLVSCHKRQKPQAPTPQAPFRNRQRRKVANAKGLKRNTNLT